VAGEPPSKTIKNWPLIEVIAEFHLPPESWSEDLPDRLFAVLEGRFPQRRRRKISTHQLSFGPGRHKQDHQETVRHQFVAANELTLVQLNKGLLTVNHLKPYSCWEQFFPSIEAVVAEYRQLVDEQLKAVALQYINRLELKGEQVTLDHHLSFRPLFEGEFARCACMAVQPWYETGSVITRQMETQQAQDGTLPVLLILHALKESAPWDDALEWLNTAHVKLDEVFKSSVTEVQLRSFKGG
jgi:uncharacterized protein (TIGR04255 family)